LSSSNGRNNRKSKGKAAPKRNLASKAAAGDLANKIEAMYDKALHLIVCGAVGIKPLSEEARRDLLSKADLYDTLLVLSELNRAFDVAHTRAGDPARVEQTFLADARQAWVDCVRRRIDQGHRLVSPRATAQLLREVIEYGSSGSDAATIDKNALVHMLLSVTSEQNMRPEFIGDVPTRRARREQAQKVEKLDLDETIAAAGTIIPDLVATHLFNASPKLEVLLSNTHDMWFRPWPPRTNATGLGATPRECFEIATGVDLLNVIHLGVIIAKQAATQQQVHFRRNQLIELGTPSAAIDLLFDHMALSLNAFQSKFADDRKAGPVGHQRYKLTQYPFLALNNDEFMMLRYGWAIDKLCGNHLFFIAWSRLIETQSKSLAERFRSAMNDVFEDVVGEILKRIASHSKLIRTIASEREMQTAWTLKRGEPPSVCDWALFAGAYCIVVDATNHPVKATLAQGLSTWEDYSADIEKNFTGKKFDQLVNTIDQLRTRGGWGDEGIDADTSFIPLVVVPDAGLPSDPLIEADLMNRSRPIFQHLQPRVLPPGVMQLSDLQLLEGLAGYYGSSRGDIVKIVVGWRYSAAKIGVPLPCLRRAMGFN
jgi:hypothetical protein